MAGSENTTNEVLAKIFKLIAPLLVGALFTLWVTSTGDHIQVQSNKEAIAALQAEVKEIKDNYATNKRVDDAVVEMRTGLTGLNNKVDQILKIMLERK